MHIDPNLAQTPASAIPAGNLFLAANNAGMGVIYLRVADSPVARKGLQAQPAKPGLIVVQLAPRSTEFNWLTTVPADLTVSDVTDALTLVYDPMPAVVAFTQDPTRLKTGDVVLARGRSWLVFIGPNPAIGLGVVDLNTGEIDLTPGPDMTVIACWRLQSSASASCGSCGT